MGLLFNLLFHLIKFFNGYKGCGLLMTIVELDKGDRTKSRVRTLLSQFIHTYFRIYFSTPFIDFITTVTPLNQFIKQSLRNLLETTKPLFKIHT